MKITNAKQLGMTVAPPSAASGEEMTPEQAAAYIDASDDPVLGAASGEPETPGIWQQRWIMMRRSVQQCAHEADDPINTLFMEQILAHMDAVEEENPPRAAAEEGENG